MMKKKFFADNHNTDGYSTVWSRMKDRYYVPLFLSLVSLGTLGFMLWLGTF